MSLTTPLAEATRERIAREFDDRGPDACMAEVIIDLERNNPELLDIAVRCSESLGNSDRIMQSFGMFYRLMIDPWLPADDPLALSPLPRVTAQTRDRLVEEIDRMGAEAFTLDIVAELERSNSELLRALHAIASATGNPLGMTQGLALFYRAVATQAAGGRRVLH